jgi:hypothetical protein
MLSWNRLTHAAGILDNLIDRSESSTEPCATRDLDARQRISENATGTRGRLLMAAALPSAGNFRWIATSADERIQEGISRWLVINKGRRARAARIGVFTSI